MMMVVVMVEERESESERKSDKNLGNSSLSRVSHVFCLCEHFEAEWREVPEINERRHRTETKSNARQ
jgi:uncharacterized protein YydD (DUF2326 family)